MFITLTINTTKIQKKPMMAMRKSKLNPAKGWHKAVHIKRRTMWQKMKDWRKSMKTVQYSLDGQAAMF